MISEKMLLVSPTLAATLGLEEALLFQLLYEIKTLQERETIELSVQKQQKLLPFWSDMQFLAVCNRLQAQGVINIVSQSPWQFIIDPLFDADEAAGTQTKLPSISKTVPVYNNTPNTYDAPNQTPSVAAVNSQATEKLPVFSMNDARRRNQEDDDLAYLKPAAKHGGRASVQRVKMTADWEPSEQFPNLLSFHNIPLAFALSELEKFRQYYLASERQEANWDIRLVNWVQRAWPESQHAKGRYEQSINTTGEPANNPREKRARVRDALRNISDTDW
ncbi:hypothetical protein KO489_06495 [Reinekea forsetii]|nr:hypothetical protein [Reinekea forsetii]